MNELHNATMKAVKDLTAKYQDRVLELREQSRDATLAHQRQLAKIEVMRTQYADSPVKASTFLKAEQKLAELAIERDLAADAAEALQNKIGVMLEPMKLVTPCSKTILAIDTVMHRLAVHVATHGHSKNFRGLDTLHQSRIHLAGQFEQLIASLVAVGAEAEPVKELTDQLLEQAQSDDLTRFVKTTAA